MGGSKIKADVNLWWFGGGSKINIYAIFIVSQLVFWHIWDKYIITNGCVDGTKIYTWLFIITHVLCANLIYRLTTNL